MPLCSISCCQSITANVSFGSGQRQRANQAVALMLAVALMAMVSMKMCPLRVERQHENWLERFKLEGEGAHHCGRPRDLG